MPGLEKMQPDVRTVYLGEFTRAHAERIAELLEERGIAWWYKAPGSMSRMWEHGIRMFVDRDKLEGSRAVVAEVLSPGTAS